MGFKVHVKQVIIFGSNYHLWILDKVFSHVGVHSQDKGHMKFCVS